MGEGRILIFASFLLIVSLFMTYWFVPFQETSFLPHDANTDFIIDSSEKYEMQFYPNLRFPSPNIFYQIEDCPLSKKGEMENAFEIIANKTILNFSSVPSNPQITITCQSTNKFQGELFIAGEGGPTEISPSGEYHIIHHGAILLIRDSKCGFPNVAVHELLHVLGFEHSSNPSNIMYNLSICGQKIGEDMLRKIDELYSIPSYPDLTLENVSAFMNGRYLNTKFTVKNIGLVSSEISKVKIYAEDKLIETVSIEELEVGTGMIITLENLFINKLSIKEISFFIEYPLEELKKNNNGIILKIQI